MKNIVIFNILENIVIIFDDDLWFVTTEYVIFDSAYTWISDKYAWFLVIFQLVTWYCYIIISDKQYPISLILDNKIILNILHPSQTNNPIIILSNLIIFNNKLFSKYSQYTLSSPFNNSIPKNKTINIIRSFQQHITF